MRDYFKDTATSHFFNVAIRCIVLIKTAFSQARHPSSCFCVIKWLNLASTPLPPLLKTPTIHTVSSMIIKVHKAGTRKLI